MHRVLAVVALIATLSSCGGTDVGLDLLVISLDTVRRDHLPTYGYPRATAPALDALALRSVVFEDAFAQESNTVPSHGSMFTGLYPHEHRARSNRHPLPEGTTTLATILRDQGYRTAAFVSGLPMTAEASGLAQGFELYDDEFEGLRRDGRIAAENAGAWLDRLAQRERSFVFVHLYDAHGPYEPQGSYRDLFSSPDPGQELKRIPRYQQVRNAGGELEHGLNRYVDRYDAMIRYVDDRLAQVLAHVDLEQTVVLVLADHGETLGERRHPLDHGGRMFDEQTRIPLVLHVPGVEPARAAGMVQTIDVLPTLLELLGLEAPESIARPGRSLVGMLSAASPGQDRVFSSARAVTRRQTDRALRLDPRRRTHSVRTEDHRLVLMPALSGADLFELYDLRNDPGELHDVGDQQPAVRDALIEELHGWLAGASALPEANTDPEMLEKLRTLGYVD